MQPDTNNPADSTQECSVQASLLVLIKRNPDGLPWLETAKLFENLLEKLIELRRDGRIHGDIKPSNILRAGDGSISLPRSLSSPGPEGARPGVIERLGSYDYMAPEYVRKDNFEGDELSEIFSVAVCFYEALTGGSPFPRLGAGGNDSFRRRWRGSEILVPPFQHGMFRVLSTEVRNFIKKGLYAEPSLRFQSYEKMLEGLRAVGPRSIHGADEYELDQVLGSGGFGEVYSARRKSDGRQVAVKWLFPGIAPRRFLKEGRLLERFRHDHIVEYIDLFETTDNAGIQQFFLVMELLDHMPAWTLRNRIRRCPDGMDIPETVELFIHYLEALEYMHRHRIVHRDIKPSNLYAPAGNPAGGKVFDLGVARDVHGTTTTGFVPGTIEYMAPELAGRAGGERGSPASDIYAIGLSLYEAITGKPAFTPLPDDEEEAWVEFLHRSDAPAGETVDCNLEPFAAHPDLGRVVLKAIAANPADRYRTAAKMRVALEEAAERLGIVITGGHVVAVNETVYEAATGRGTGSVFRDGGKTSGEYEANRCSADSFGGSAQEVNHGQNTRRRRLARLAIAASAAAVIAMVAALSLHWKGTVELGRQPGQLQVGDQVNVPVASRAVQTEPSHLIHLPSNVMPPGKANSEQARVEDASPVITTDPATPVTVQAEEKLAPKAMPDWKPLLDRTRNAVKMISDKSGPDDLADIEKDLGRLDRNGDRDAAGCASELRAEASETIVGQAERMASAVKMAYGLNNWPEGDSYAARLSVFSDAVPAGLGGTRVREIRAEVEIARTDAISRRNRAVVVKQGMMQDDSNDGGQPVTVETNSRDSEAARRKMEEIRVENGNLGFDAADKSVREYVKWLYQVADPAVGSRRRKVEKPPALDIKLPAAGKEGISRAKLTRLEAWQSGAAAINTVAGREKLAGQLVELSMLPDAGSGESVRCAFEGMALAPGAKNATRADVGAIPEIHCMKAHGMYEPGEPAGRLLKEMETFARQGGKPDDYDLRLALYAAFNTLDNVVEGEDEYRLAAEHALELVMESASGEQVQAAVKYVAGKAEQGDRMGIFMMKTLATMPEIARAAGIKP